MKKMVIKRLVLLSTLLLLTGGLLPVAALAAETPSVSYSTHVQNEGWQDYKSNGEMSGTAGKSYRLEGIKIKLDDQGYDLGVSYQTHIQNIGWEAETSRGWKSDDAMSGTEGLSYRLEAIQIKLTGADAAKFDIFYQVHAQNMGWLGWAKNGESAGTAGYGYRLEGIKILVVPAGAAAPGSTENAYSENLAPLYKQAYREVVKANHKMNMGPYFCNYSLFDMNSDNIPELILDIGTCEADRMYNVYTFKNKQAVFTGKFSSAHSRLYGRTSSEAGQLIEVQGHMLWQQVYEVNLNNQAVSRNLILQNYVDSVADYYKTEYEVPYFKSSFKDEHLTLLN